MLRVGIQNVYNCENKNLFAENKGPAFKLLVDAMRINPNEKLYQKGKAKRTYGEAATE